MLVLVVVDGFNPVGITPAGWSPLALHFFFFFHLNSTGSAYCIVSVWGAMAPLHLSVKNAGPSLSAPPVNISKSHRAPFLRGRSRWAGGLDT